MITKDDWNDALDAWIVEERERLGGPPSPEDVVAYLSGELAPADAARVRALLIYYPELTPLLTERIEKPRKTWTPVVQRLYPIAATIALVFAGADAIVQRHLNSVPAVLTSQHEFNRESTRGTGPVYELRGGQQRYLITAIPAETPTAPSYEMEITRDSRVVWTAKDVRPLNDAFVVDIPGKFLSPGTYTLTIRTDREVTDRCFFRVTE
ncbi:MAG TPA: hypothetical protein VJZ00_00435 [Thermoanaerobaculia bacterium]|nr:hypothetical protein [Thermoanaerobaculia bacterium]